MPPAREVYRAVALEVQRHAARLSPIVAGVKRLQTSEEISDAIRRIVDRAGTHPLVGEARRLAPASLKEFFADVTVRGPVTIGEKEALAKARSTAAPE